MRTRVTASEEPGADARFCLVFPREALSVPVMRHVLGETLDQLGVTDGCVADLLLAVTEACTNVLRHSGPGLRYEVVARVGPNRCVLEVVDGGRGFDPATVPAYRASRHRGAGRPMARLRRRWAHDPGPDGTGFDDLGLEALELDGLELDGPADDSPVFTTAAPSRPGARRSRLSRPRRPAHGDQATDGPPTDEQVTALAESGRGLAIMQACVDDVTLRSRPGHGTVVSLGKRIELRSDAPLSRAALPQASVPQLRDAG
jgi:anti-sigma regulatory factor (Ser/Thr protein kinase)